jgi:hypothetical protein
MTRLPAADAAVTARLAVSPSRPAVVGGIDTHKDMQVAAVIDGSEHVPGTSSFSTTRAGYRALVRWMRGFGELTRVGVEGTGSFGAGITRHLVDVDIAVLEVDRPSAAARAKTTTLMPSPPRKRRCADSAPAPRRPRTARSSHCGCYGTCAAPR